MRGVLRAIEVGRQELLFGLRRPMIWILLAFLAFLSWGLSTGSVSISAGAGTVGGRKAWITSEFSVAYILTIVVGTFYAFFVAASAGLATIRDDEAKLNELLHSTPLRPREYVWGKGLGVLVLFLGVLLAHVALMTLFNHVLPNPTAADVRGPFQFANYLRPTLIFSVPLLVFFTGTTFFLGARWRRPTLVFLFPLALTVASGFFLWNWAPTWLAPGVNRLLMALDPGGVRWLNETWLKLDRGADFYNTARITVDWPFLLSRLALIGLGLLGFGLSERAVRDPFRATAPGESGRWWQRRRRKQAQGVEVAAGIENSTALPLSSQSPPGVWQAAWWIARAEARTLAREPGVYIFSAFVLTQTLGTTLVNRGAFQTLILHTPGQLVANSFNTVIFMLVPLLMFFLVEALMRERIAGVAPLVYGAPFPTVALLAGKVAATAGLGVVVLAAVFTGQLIALVTQGQVSPSLVPYGLVWGLLLAPTLLVWCAFICFVQAAFGSRFVSLGAGLAVLGFTLYRQFTGGMDWVGNWMLWNVVRWSDISVLELDRTALALNRVMVLGLAVFFLVLATRLFQRQAFDAAGLLVRLSPPVLLRQGLRLLPYAALPLAAGLALHLMVLDGSNGETARAQDKKYWKQNIATWKDAPQPALEAVEIELHLEPESSSFRTSGRYVLMNPHEKPLRRFGLTGGRHWRDVVWTLAGASYEPDDRSGLFVFTPEAALEPGQTVEVGFELSGRVPDGVSENGGGLQEFIFPASVVLTSFSGSFAPVVGFAEGRGVDDDNRMDPRDYPEDGHLEKLQPAFGSSVPFTTRITVSVPEDLRVNSVGVLESEEVKEGRRTSVWVSDQPVRFFNVAAGRWQVRHGEGVLLYHHPQHTYNVEEMARVLAAARRHYSEWFHPYPWRELKLSEFAGLATYAQGFPTNITFSEGIGFLTKSDEKTNAVLLVTAHEAAHQWWGNLLTPGHGPGGNVLSEGMSHFATKLLIEELEGTPARMEFSKRIEERYGNRRVKDEERPLIKIDGARPGDATLTYDKGGWVAFMLMRTMGREAFLSGLRQFIAERKDGPDYPLLQDMVTTLRPLAADPEAFDLFVRQWFYEVVVPEYRVQDANKERGDAGWSTTFTLSNTGTGRMPVTLAAVQGERFDEHGEPRDDYHDSRTVVSLGAGESQTVVIKSAFEPEQVVVDPDVEVLQLNRKTAKATL